MSVFGYQFGKVLYFFAVFEQAADKFEIGILFAAF